MDDFDSLGNFADTASNISMDNLWGDISEPLGSWANDLGNFANDIDFSWMDNFPESNSSWLDALPNMGDAPSAWGNSSGSIKDALSTVFNSQYTPLAAKGLAALYEGSQNKKAASAYRNLANSSMMDPFGTQRGQYQTQLQQAMTNPNSIPQIQQQTQALAKAQAIKDAAAGRRSNNATSSPGLLLAQSQAAQDYIKQLSALAGANIQPNSNAFANAMGGAIKSDTQGYISPLLNILGYSTQPKVTTNNQTGVPNSTLSELQALFNN